MNRKNLCFASINAVLIGFFSGYTNAGLPEACFESDLDYKIYQQYGTGYPYAPESHLGVYVYNSKFNETMKMFKHGPARKKPISINTKEITANGKSYMDASESTTPSGEKSYFWQAVDEKSIMDSTSKFPLTPAGAEYLFNLTVSDPVCETKATQQLKLHIH